MKFCEHYSSSVKNNNMFFSNLVPAINNWKANDQHLTVTKTPKVVKRIKPNIPRLSS
jgi:hypothetical protein